MSGLPVSHLKRYGGAVASTVVALLLSLLMQSIVQRVPFIFFFGAVAFSAGYGGLGPGLLATFLSVAFVDYFLLVPHNVLSFGPEDLFILVLFMAISGLISTLYDRHKRAEAQAHEQADALRVTLNSIGDAVITTNTKAAVTFLNPKAEELTGWQLAEAVDQDIQKVFRIVNEQTRQPVENPIFKVLQGGITVGLANHTILIDKNGTERAIDDSAAPIRNVAGSVIGTVLTFRDISERRQAEIAQQLLIELSDLLISSLNYETTFYKIAIQVVPTLADWCEIAVLENDQLRQLALVHVDPAKQKLLEKLYKDSSALPGYLNAAQETVRAGHAILNTEINDTRLPANGTDAQSLERLRELQLKSQLYMPLIFNGRTLGAIGFNRSANRPNLSQAEVTLAEEVARRVTVALENARLYQQAQQNQQAAARTADRIARLQAITAALEDALLPMQVAKTIVDQTIAVIDGAYGSLVALADDKDRKLNVIYSAGYTPEWQQRWGNISLDADSPLSDMV